PGRDNKASNRRARSGGQSFRRRAAMPRWRNPSPAGAGSRATDARAPLPEYAGKPLRGVAVRLQSRKARRRATGRAPCPAAQFSRLRLTPRSVPPTAALCKRGVCKIRQETWQRTLRLDSWWLLPELSGSLRGKGSGGLKGAE